jgi:hypothetical protein
MNLINKLCTGWTALKFVRVGLGSLILYTSIENGLLPGIVLGGLFTVISLFTAGVCCPGSGYYTTIKKMRGCFGHTPQEKNANR